MILGQSEIQKLIKEIGLVTNLSEREKNDPEGCIIDLRIEKIYSLTGEAFLGIEERQTPSLIEMATWNPKRKTFFTFEPGKYYLTKTIEEVNVPENLGGTLKPRSTTFRSGLNIRTGFINPGYHGPLYFGLANEGPIPVKIEMGARYVSIYFHEVSGKSVHTYRGQWQGGRATTGFKEKQI